MKLTSETQTTTISTTSFSKLRGFTFAVLHELSKEASTSFQLSEKTLKPTNYVNSYLFRLRKYGLADKQDYSWFLTALGRDVVGRLNDIILSYITTYYTNNTRTTLEQQKNNTSHKRSHKQISLESWTRNTSPTDCEKEVVDILVNHYNSTGSKYIFFRDQYILSEKVGFSVHVLQESIHALRADNVVYLLKDNTSGMWKLGLKKAFVEALAKEK
jgi:hypothetical protein